MARRRRHKNTLLPKVFAVAILVNAVVILVAARFGAFKAIQREFGTSKVVLVTPAEVPKEKPKPEEKKKEAVKTAPTHKAAGAPSKSSSAAHARTSTPNVVTSGPAGDGPGGGPVAPPGTLAPGAVPTEKTTTKPVETAPPPQPRPETKLEAKPSPTPAIKPTPEPAPKPEPKFIECEPIAQPQPAIPDDLRSEELSKDYVAELQVGADGVPTSVKTVQPTGIDELDRLALEAARKWRFTPATLGGVPTAQTVRITMQFRVQ